MMDQIRNELAQGNGKNAIQPLITLLLCNPLNSEYTYLLSEAMKLEGYGEAALELADRAWLLDPRSTWLETYKHSLPVVAEDGSLPPYVSAFMELDRSPTVAAIIVMRNEERTIERCIRSLQGCVDEIIAVDTGSTDRSIEIVLSLGVEVHRFEWCDDFSKARNYALSLVESDWVLIVDADEALHEEDRHCPRLAASLFDRFYSGHAVLGRVQQVNETVYGIQNEYSMVRFFNTGKGITYRGRIHEQPAVDGECPVLFPELRIRLKHDGYMPDIMEHKNKLERNIRLLEMDVAEHPSSPAIWGLLGREFLVSEQYEEAIRALKQAVKYASAEPAYVRCNESWKLLADAYYFSGRLDEALEANAFGVAAFPDYPDLQFQSGQLKLIKALELLGAAGTAFHSSKDLVEHYRGVVSADEHIRIWKADAGIADTLFFQGRLTEAYSCYRDIAERNPGQQGIHDKLQEIERQLGNGVNELHG